MTKAPFQDSFSQTAWYKKAQSGHQEANQPIRNNQYNAYAYSPDTFPLVSPQPVALEPAPAARQTPATRLSPAAEIELVNVPMPQPNPVRHKPAQLRPAQRQVMFGGPSIR